jgi:type I restriction enzyme, S subunit
MSNQSDILSAPICLPEAIPNNWEWNLLTDHAEPKQWATISSSQLQKNGYSVYGANGLIGYYSEYNHEHETIAITCRGATCGTVNLIPSKSYVTGNAMCLDSLNDETIAFKYLYYALSFRHLSDVISGSAQPQITREGLSNVLFPVPPLPEQQKIASILTSVDTVIEKTEAQINKLKDLKQAMMQELLTKGIGHTEFKDSPVGKIPVSWEVKSLGTFITKLISGASLAPKDFCQSGFPVIPKKAIQETGKLSITKQTYASMEYAEDNKNNWVDNNYLITTLRDLVPTGPSIGRIVQFEDDKKYILAQGVYGFILNPKLEKSFLTVYSNSDSFRLEMRKIFVGSTQVHIRTNEYLETLISIPPLKEQKGISQVFISIDSHVEKKKQKLQHTQSLKLSLMQDLLTGKVRTMN